VERGALKQISSTNCIFYYNSRLVNWTILSTNLLVTLGDAALLRLVGPADADRWDHRGHFFAAAAAAMRRILIERARQKQRLIHGGGRRREPLHPDLVAAPQPDEELLALDAPLAKLAQRDPVKARLVELRYFAGLTGDETAAILGTSPSTADRHWIYARAWLRCEVQAGKTLKKK